MGLENLEVAAQRIVRKFGLAAEIERPGANIGDPWAPVFGPPTLHPVFVVVGEYDQDERSGTLIQQNDLKITLSTEGLSIEPDTADTLRIDGTDYTIVRVSPVAPDGVPKVYTLQVRT